MKKRDLETKTNSIMRDIQAMMIEKRERMLKSGCVDLASEPENYALAKDFICAFAREIEHQYATHKGMANHKKSRRRIANIYASI